MVPLTFFLMLHVHKKISNADLWLECKASQFEMRVLCWALHAGAGDTAASAAAVPGEHHAGVGAQPKACQGAAGAEEDRVRQWCPLLPDKSW